MSGKMKVFISVILAMGIGLIAYQPVMNYLVIPSALDDQYRYFDELTREEITVNAERFSSPDQNQDELPDDERFDFSAVESVETEDLQDAKLDHDAVVGSIVIPSVDVALPILYGATHDNMMVGAGTMKPGQAMGEGNYALSSHAVQNPGLLFTPIRHIEAGELMYVTDKEQVYVYEASYREVIEPTRIEVIHDQADRRMLTLISCHASDGSDRIVVQGDLVDVVSLENMDSEMKERLLQLK
ncbi:class A sortase [Salisediminibacterium beveridgei]|uniref:Sortase family protein n=1 Tax=Salisediminibacterium beveridgei TaxID=632773 RepID=A0A1D7QRU2_9BACI|nr:class A sortase [Salisediminibacterium beveridgei]AOM81736.1 sortase family protein [Salisediminibacterium beveridgei]